MQVSNIDINMYKGDICLMYYIWDFHMADDHNIVDGGIYLNWGKSKKGEIY